MTELNIPDVTDDDRELARKWAASVESNPNFWGDIDRAAARVILHDLPDPPRPTLADMNEEERAACIRMQCDTAPNRSVRGFIADVYPGGCRVIERDTWEWRSYSDDMVTPRPDLPRIGWPGTEKPAPDLPGGWRLADHKKRGRVLVTRPDPDVNGNVVIVCSDPHLITRAALTWCDRDKLTFLDAEQEADQ